MTKACTHTFVTKKAMAQFIQKNHWSTHGQTTAEFCFLYGPYHGSLFQNHSIMCYSMYELNVCSFIEFSCFPVMVSSKYIANFRKEKALVQLHAFNMWFNTGRTLNKYILIN